MDNPYQNIPLFQYCNQLPNKVNSIISVSEWLIHNNFSNVLRHLEKRTNPTLIIHAYDCVHPYHSDRYDQVMLHLRDYFLNNPQSSMIYYSVNFYELFNGIENIDYHWIPEYHAYYWPIYKDITIDTQPISKKFLCLNKRVCISRWLLYKKFYTDNLLESSVFSFLGEDNRWGTLDNKLLISEIEQTIQSRHPEFAHLKTPTTTFYQIENDHNLEKYLTEDRASKLKKPLVDSSWVLDHQFYQQTFCSIIGETSYRSDKPNFSEKTFRAICNGHPFILIGGQHSLQFLRNLGFDTYDDIFDNSYDTVKDPTQRLLAVFDAIDQISNKDMTQLDQIKQSLYHRRLKNIQTYSNLYDQLINKSNQLQETLKKYVQSKI